MDIKRSSYQCKLQEKSHTIDLPSIQIDKYETIQACAKDLYETVYDEINH